MQRFQYDDVFRCIGHKSKALKSSTWLLEIESISENSIVSQGKIQKHKKWMNGFCSNT